MRIIFTKNRWPQTNPTFVLENLESRYSTPVYSNVFPTLKWRIKWVTNDLGVIIATITDYFRILEQVEVLDQFLHQFTKEQAVSHRLPQYYVTRS